MASKHLEGFVSTQQKRLQITPKLYPQIFFREIPLSIYAISPVVQHKSVDLFMQCSCRLINFLPPGEKSLEFDLI
jgi:hypothetical protein